MYEHLLLGDISVNNFKKGPEERDWKRPGKGGCYWIASLCAGSQGKSSQYLCEIHHSLTSGTEPWPWQTERILKTSSEERQQCSRYWRSIEAWDGMGVGLTKAWPTFSLLAWKEQTMEKWLPTFPAFLIWNDGSRGAVVGKLARKLPLHLNSCWIGQLSWVETILLSLDRFGLHKFR